jgi:hypothetical protein
MKVQIRYPLLKEVGCFCELGKELADLHFTAAWKNGDAVRIRVLLLWRRDADRVYQGMTHEIGTHVVLSVEGLLEGKDAQHAPDVFADEVDPAFTPGPDLGTDVVVHRNTQLGGHLGHMEMKVRGVEENEAAGMSLAQGTLNAAKEGKDAGKEAQNLTDAHGRNVLRPGYTLQPFTVH